MSENSYKGFSSLIQNYKKVSALCINSLTMACLLVEIELLAYYIEPISDAVDCYFLIIVFGTYVFDQTGSSVRPGLSEFYFCQKISNIVST